MWTGKRKRIGSGQTGAWVSCGEGPYWGASAESAGRGEGGRQSLGVVRSIKVQGISASFPPLLAHSTTSGAEAGSSTGGGRKQR